MDCRGEQCVASLKENIFVQTGPCFDLRRDLIFIQYFQVKAVSSLTINCQSPVRANSDKLQTFPLGTNALFAVTLHDNIGRAFAVASIPLKYRLNRQVSSILIIV